MKKFISLLIMLCLVSCTFVGCTKSENVKNDSKTEIANKDDKIVIVDSAGRTVELKKDINKVSLMNTGSLEVMRALGLEDKISSVPSIVPKSLEYFPEKEIQSKPVITSSKDISYESLIEMNPDVVITFANKRYCDIEELEKKLSSTNIKIVALNFYNPLNVTDEIKTMGKIFNLEEKAGKLTKLIQGYLDTVKERVSKIKEEDKVNVYYERFMGDYKSAAKGSGYHDLIAMAGGKNIFEDSKSPYPTVSSEEILIRKPDVIVKGDNVSKTTKDMQQYVDSLASRPGWDKLEAVKNNKVYVISSSIMTDGIRKSLAVCYLAKTLYPKLFSDLDIDEFKKEFFEYQKPGKLNVFMYPKVK